MFFLSSIAAKFARVSSKSAALLGRVRRVRRSQP